MHGYIGRNEIEKLVQDDRQGVIVFGVKTSDIDEYINSLLRVLSDKGFNTNLLTQAKIRKIGKGNRDNEYAILLTIRKSYNLKKEQYKKFEWCFKSIVAHSCSISDWIKLKYNIHELKTKSS